MTKIFHSTYKVASQVNNLMVDEKCLFSTSGSLLTSLISFLAFFLGKFLIRWWRQIIFFVTTMFENREKEKKKWKLRLFEMNWSSEWKVCNFSFVRSLFPYQAFSHHVFPCRASNRLDRLVESCISHCTLHLSRGTAADYDKKMYRKMAHDRRWKFQIWCLPFSALNQNQVHWNSWD